LRVTSRGYAHPIGFALDMLAIALLVLANAFFVLAEYALITARRSALERRAEAGSKGAALALRMQADPVRVIGTVQIGITALGILLGAVGERALRGVFEPVMATALAFVLAFLIVTYLSVAFGELVPKALALHDADRLAALVARPIDLLARVFAPAVWVLQGSAAAVLRPLGVPAVTAGEQPVSREELRGLLQDAEQQGELRADEEDMLTAVIDLRSRQVRDIMVPWDRVCVLRAEQSLEDVRRTLLSTPHSRYPVVRDRHTVIGVLHARDVFRIERTGADLESVVRPPVIVPPTLPVDALLRELRRARQHLGVVIDEYGEPFGIATLEDALEEIVGEIEDEFDRPALAAQRVGDHAWRVAGALSISDFNRATGAALEAESVHSVGGLVLDALGRAAQAGDEVEVDGFRLTVEAVDGTRIAVVRAEPSAAAGDEGSERTAGVRDG
jgi:putative hemolysin